MAELNKLNKKSQKRNNRAGFLFLLPLIVIFIGLLGYSFYFLSVNSFRDVTITFRHTEFTGLANYKTVYEFEILAFFTRIPLFYQQRIFL